MISAAIIITIDKTITVAIFMINHSLFYFSLKKPIIILTAAVRRQVRPRRIIMSAFPRLILVFIIYTAFLLGSGRSSR